jgi:MOSC domain-containing protein YiiM
VSSEIALPYARDIRIELLLASPASRYEGRPAGGPQPRTPEERAAETPPEINVRAGLGIVGDRYFNRPAHRLASVTLFAAETLETVAAELGTGPLDVSAARRNVVLRGVDVDALRGATVSLDSGDGEVVLAVHRPAHPCAWMDAVLAPGAFRALRGRGGMRCEPLTDGVLRVGPAVLRSSVPLASA